MVVSLKIKIYTNQRLQVKKFSIALIVRSFQSSHLLVSLKDTSLDTVQVEIFLSCPNRLPIKKKNCAFASKKHSVSRTKTET